MSLKDLIQASAVHTSISKECYTYIKPGMSLSHIADWIESEIKTRVKYDASHPLERGVAFPSGVSVNHVTAHYRPNHGEKEYILQKEDVIKVDYGVHVNGHIIDSAFTLAFDSKYDELIRISKNATHFAIKMCGPDVAVSEIGKAVEEYVESKEVILDGTTHRLHTMRELCGHSIGPYRIHDGLAIPNTRIENYPRRLQENQVVAIEPFITTGTGKSCESLTDNLPISHYKMISHRPSPLLDILQKHFYTLPFSQKALCELYSTKDIDKELGKLVKEKYIESYPPIYSEPNSIVCQHEHTLFIKGNGGAILLTKNPNY